MPPRYYPPAPRATLYDTVVLEEAAENLVSHKLLQAGLLVAKPKFDERGTDLIVLAEMADGVKFCRVQCKGRSVARSSSSISIPESYVTNGFVVILCVDTGPTQLLYCFFASDIQQWRLTDEHEYQLPLGRTTFQTKLAFYLLDEARIDLIRNTIRHAQVAGEFRRLVYGSGSSTVPSPQLRAVGTVTPPPRGAD